MVLKDVMLEASSEHEIYFLLTAYIEALHYGDRLDALPRCLKGLPLEGLKDIRERCERISAELSATSERREDSRRTIVAEAADVFGAAFTRLQRLDRKAPELGPE